MNIDTIKNGYVIDHITAGNAIKIYNMLELNKLDCQVALITNAKSNKTKIKDIIKIGSLIDINLDKIAFVNPLATVNIVQNEKIIEKKNPTVVGLDPKLEYVPEFIQRRYLDKDGWTLKAAAKAIYDFNLATIIKSFRKTWCEFFRHVLSYNDRNREFFGQFGQ